MKWASFAYGSAIGVAVALGLSVSSTEFLKRQPDVNLGNTLGLRFSASPFSG
jgi:hypothetical protein